MKRNHQSVGLDVACAETGLECAVSGNDEEQFDLAWCLRHANSAVDGGGDIRHVLAALGDSQRLAALARKGVDVDADTGYGMRPIHYAAAAGHTTTVSTLIVRGARLERVGVNGESVMAHAGEGTPACLRFLLAQRRTDVNDAALDGQTALHRARFSSHAAENIRLLIEAGADVNARDENGWTPLHCALDYGNDDMVRQLMASGADFRIPDKKGETPLALAARLLEKNKCSNQSKVA